MADKSLNKTELVAKIAEVLAVGRYRVPIVGGLRVVVSPLERGHIDGHLSKRYIRDQKQGT